MDIQQRRETNGATVRLVLHYVRERGGEEAVRELLRLAGETRPVAVLDDERTWSSYATKIALFGAAARVTDDELVARRIGEALLATRVASSLKLLMSLLGSPGQAVRSLARAAPKLTTVADTRAVEVGASHAVVTYRLHPGYLPSRYDCDYTIGLLSQIPVLFGLPKAAVAHDSCQVRGAAECRYELTWRRRTPLDRLRRQRGGPPATAREVEALRDKLAALQHATADLVSSEDLDAVLPRIALQASSAVCAQRYLLAVRLNGDSEPRVHSDGFSVDAAHTLGVALLDDPDASAAAGFSALVADVVSARANHGRLAAFFPVGQPFFSAEQDLLNAYARLAAAALDATAALAAARERGRTAEALLALASSLARAEQHHEIAQVVARAALAVTGADRAAVLLRDPMSGAVTVRSDTAANDTATNDTAADATDPLAVADAQAQELSELLTAGRGPGLYPPGTADPLSHCVRHALAATDGSMLAVAPVMANGDLLGAVAVLCPPTRPGLPGAPLLARLSGLADQASTALVNASLVAQVRHEATHDALTGLANRRLFLERVERDLEACRRRGGRLAVLFIDLDRFKPVNDDLGHAAGDELLRQFAGRLGASVRSGDLVARAGGDEFTVLLPSVTGDDEVEAVAARIVVACAEPFRVAGHQLTVTPSIGAAVSPRDGSTGTALMSGADAAMYEAKHAGRNTYRTLLRG